MWHYFPTWGLPPPFILLLLFTLIFPYLLVHLIYFPSWYYTLKKCIFFTWGGHTCVLVWFFSHSKTTKIILLSTLFFFLSRSSREKAYIILQSSELLPCYKDLKHFAKAVSFNQIIIDFPIFWSNQKKVENCCDLLLSSWIISLSSSSHQYQSALNIWFEITLKIITFFSLVFFLGGGWWKFVNNMISYNQKTLTTKTANISFFGSQVCLAGYVSYIEVASTYVYKFTYI